MTDSLDTDLTSASGIIKSNECIRISAWLESRQLNTTVAPEDVPAKIKKKSMTPAMRMQLYRQRLKESGKYGLYKERQKFLTESSRARSSEEQKQRNRELTRARVRKCRERKKAAGQPLHAPMTYTGQPLHAPMIYTRERKDAIPPDNVPVKIEEDMTPSIYIQSFEENGQYTHYEERQKLHMESSRVKSLEDQNQRNTELAHVSVQKCREMEEAAGQPLDVPETNTRAKDPDDVPIKVKEEDLTPSSGMNFYVWNLEESRQYELHEERRKLHTESSRANRSEEQKQRTRELTRARVQKYRERKKAASQPSDVPVIYAGARNDAKTQDDVPVKIEGDVTSSMGMGFYIQSLSENGPDEIYGEKQKLQMESSRVKSLEEQNQCNAELTHASAQKCRERERAAGQPLETSETNTRVIHDAKDPDDDLIEIKEDTTPSLGMDFYIQSLKEIEQYELYEELHKLQMERSRAKRLEEQKKRTRELTHARVQKYRERKKAAGRPLDAPETNTRALNDTKALDDVPIEIKEEDMTPSLGTDFYIQSLKEIGHCVLCEEKHKLHMGSSRAKSSEEQNPCITELKHTSEQKCRERQNIKARNHAKASNDILVIKKGMTAAVQMQHYRKRLKESGQYELYKERQRFYSEKSRANKSEEQKQRIRELTRTRVRKYRERKKAAGQPSDAPMIYTGVGNNAKTSDHVPIKTEEVDMAFSLGMQIYSQNLEENELSEERHKFHMESSRPRSLEEQKRWNSKLTQAQVQKCREREKAAGQLLGAPETNITRARTDAKAPHDFPGKIKKQGVTDAMRMQCYRQRLKESGQYDLYKERQKFHTESSRARRSEEQKQRNRELTRVRVQKYRERKKAAGQSQLLNASEIQPLNAPKIYIEVGNDAKQEANKERRCNYKASITPQKKAAITTKGRSKKHVLKVQMNFLFNSKKCQQKQKYVPLRLMDTVTK